jgi:transcriptional regulator with XRE-family HTH domain
MANNLKKLRNARGWNQRIASLSLGTTINMYGKLERGERPLSTKWIERAAAIYGVDPGNVVGESAGDIRLVGRVVKGPSGQAPEFELGVRLSAPEARQFARLLVGTAAEAEELMKRR